MSGIEIAAVIASAAATIGQGYSEYKSGKAEKEAYDKNAAILRRNAAQKRLETSLNEDLQRSENRKRISAARAAMGEAGILESATSLGALGQMSAEAEQSVLNYRYEGESEAQNYIEQADWQNYYGRAAKAKGKNAFKMSMINTGINLLSSAAFAFGGPGEEATKQAAMGLNTEGFAQQVGRKPTF